MTPIEQLVLIVSRTAHPHIYGDPTYAALGLTSEAGEVAGEAKKIIRNDHGVLTDDRRERILDELADVLWYCQAVAVAAGFELEECIEHLDIKLAGRIVRGEINER